MSSYIQLQFDNISPSQSEQLIAVLNEAGYEGFEEGDNELKAFIASHDFDETTPKQIAESLQVHFSKTIIEETNWNQVWESNFQPVIVDDFVGIRASFHEPLKELPLELIITPKMSFGTGHHATTYMMIRQMKEIDFNNKSVLDFGTGTGVLAILAKKLGASRVVAIDNDDWSIANAEENIYHNQAEPVELMKAESAVLGGSFDIILANINKHVILENLPVLARQLSQNGVLIISGFLSSDEDEMTVKTLNVGLKLRDSHRLQQHNWLCLWVSR